MANISVVWDFLKQNNNAIGNAALVINGVRLH